MVRFWLRHLFGETRKKTPQKSPDPTFSPTSDEPVAISTPMWCSSLRLANVPAYVDYDEEGEEEEEDDCQPMWYRDSDHPSGCPCCIEGTGFPRPPSTALSSPDYGGHPRKASRASTHVSTSSADSEARPGSEAKEPSANPACETTVRFRRSVSTFGLRMKKSMKNLNRRPSGSLR
ncbi:hypothetical protein INS49_009648 [Diaporthe citri]|uniref:uncharacterized protein n=1 Tax=Diaporthe citri TaxID=83186 RepID=UPI001C825331|nr:uncharacterized protein INS49_009648 [Diaporthe citri]KAG6361421.1 hypothetical protein INS49_009648 [Diaporthe citri]